MTITETTRQRLKNLTITVDAETASWVRRQAAERGMSVSRFVGEALQERMEQHIGYARAMQYFLSQKPVPLRDPGESFPARDELHGRARLR